MPPVPPSPPEARPYVSAKRAAAAEQTRARIVGAAQRLLDDGPAQMSMEAVAKAAGVTRLTVYKQFGSRRALLEAVFDDNARRFGFARMAEVLAQADPRQGLRQAIEFLCAFWGANPSFGRLHDAAAADPEFAEALATRNERRRRLVDTLLSRMPGAMSARRDCSDLIFGMTSMAMFRLLSISRTPAEVADVLNAAVTAVLDAKGLG
jgi:AcrR family transcriptional regulator